MNVKKNILVFTFLLGNLFIVTSLFMENASIGHLWYFVNANSLVGVQSLIENNFHSSFFKFLVIFLDCNLFLISGFTLLFFSYLYA